MIDDNIVDKMQAADYIKTPQCLLSYTDFFLITFDINDGKH